MDEYLAVTHRSSFIRLICPWSRSCLPVQGLSISHASSDEFRPFRNHRYGIGFFRQQAPEQRMMPTEFVASTVAMLTNTLTEPFDFLNQLLPPHVNKIFVHTS